MLGVLTPVRNRLTAEVSDLRDKTEELRLMATKAKAASDEHARRRTLSQQLTLQAAKLREQVAVLEAQQREDARRTVACNEELAALKAEPAPNDSELAEISARVSDLAQLRAKATADVQAAERLQQDIRRSIQAAAEHREAAARAAAIKAAGLVLREVKAEAVASAFGSLLDRANRLCAGVLPARLCYDPERAEVGFVGRHGFYSHKSASGTEKALAYVAISAALSAQAPFRLLMLDELGRLVPSLQLQVMKNFRAAVERGELDQVLVVLPIEAGRVPDAVAPEGWSLLLVGHTEGVLT